MAIKYRYQMTLREGDTNRILMDETVELEAGSSPLIDETIPQNSEDLKIPIALDASALKGLVILSDKDMSIATNDDADGSPGHTITLEANKPLFWHADSGLANPLGSTDVTDMRITTGAVGDARFRVWPLQDPTP